MLLKRLLKGTGKRDGKGYVKTDCSRGGALHRDAVRTKG